MQFLVLFWLSFLGVSFGYKCKNISCCCRLFQEVAFEYGDRGVLFLKFNGPDARIEVTVLIEEMKKIHSDCAAEIPCLEQEDVIFGGSTKVLMHRLLSTFPVILALVRMLPIHQHPLIRHTKLEVFPSFQVSYSERHNLILNGSAWFHASSACDSAKKESKEAFVLFLASPFCPEVLNMVILNGKCTSIPNLHSSMMINDFYLKVYEVMLNTQEYEWIDLAPGDLFHHSRSATMKKLNSTFDDIVMNKNFFHHENKLCWELTSTFNLNFFIQDHLFPKTEEPIGGSFQQSFGQNDARIVSFKPGADYKNWFYICDLVLSENTLLLCFTSRVLLTKYLFPVIGRKDFELFKSAKDEDSVEYSVALDASISSIAYKVCFALVEGFRIAFAEYSILTKAEIKSKDEAMWFVVRFQHADGASLLIHVRLESPYICASANDTIYSELVLQHSQNSAECIVQVSINNNRIKILHERSTFEIKEFFGRNMALTARTVVPLELAHLQSLEKLSGFWNGELIVKNAKLLKLTSHNTNHLNVVKQAIVSKALNCVKFDGLKFLPSTSKVDLLFELFCEKDFIAVPKCERFLFVKFNEERCALIVVGDILIDYFEQANEFMNYSDGIFTFSYENSLHSLRLHDCKALTVLNWMQQVVDFDKGLDVFGVAFDQIVSQSQVLEEFVKRECKHLFPSSFWVKSKENFVIATKRALKLDDFFLFEVKSPKVTFLSCGIAEIAFAEMNIYLLEDDFEFSIKDLIWNSLYIQKDQVFWVGIQGRVEEIELCSGTFQDLYKSIALLRSSSTLSVSQLSIHHLREKIAEHKKGSISMLEKVFSLGTKLQFDLLLSDDFIISRIRNLELERAHLLLNSESISAERRLSLLKEYQQHLLNSPIDNSEDLERVLNLLSKGRDIVGNVILIEKLETPDLQRISLFRLESSGDFWIVNSNIFAIYIHYSHSLKAFYNSPIGPDYLLGGSQLNCAHSLAHLSSELLDDGIKLGNGVLNFAEILPYILQCFSTLRPIPKDCEAMASFLRENFYKCENALLNYAVLVSKPLAGERELKLALKQIASSKIEGPLVAVEHLSSKWTIFIWKNTQNLFCNLLVNQEKGLEVFSLQNSVFTSFQFPSILVESTTLHEFLCLLINSSDFSNYALNEEWNDNLHLALKSGKIEANLAHFNPVLLEFLAESIQCSSANITSNLSIETFKRIQSEMYLEMKRSLLERILLARQTLTSHGFLLFFALLEGLPMLEGTCLSILSPKQIRFSCLMQEGDTVEVLKLSIESKKKMQHLQIPQCKNITTATFYEHCKETAQHAQCFYFLEQRYAEINAQKLLKVPFLLDFIKRNLNHPNVIALIVQSDSETKEFFFEVLKHHRTEGKLCLLLWSAFFASDERFRTAKYSESTSILHLAWNNGPELAISFDHSKEPVNILLKKHSENTLSTVNLAILESPSDDSSNIPAFQKRFIIEHLEEPHVARIIFHLSEKKRIHLLDSIRDEILSQEGHFLSFACLLSNVIYRDFEWEDVIWTGSGLRIKVANTIVEINTKKLKISAFALCSLLLDQKQQQDKQSQRKDQDQFADYNALWPSSTDYLPAEIQAVFLDCWNEQRQHSLKMHNPFKKTSIYNHLKGIKIDPVDNLPVLINLLDRSFLIDARLTECNLLKEKQAIVVSSQQKSVLMPLALLKGKTFEWAVEEVKRRLNLSNEPQEHKEFL